MSLLRKDAYADVVFIALLLLIRFLRYDAEALPHERERGVVPGVDTALAFMRQRFGVLAK